MFGNSALLAYSIRQLRSPSGFERRHFMMAKRTVLLGMLICLAGAARAIAQPAVIAPNDGRRHRTVHDDHGGRPPGRAVHPRRSTAGTRRASPASSTPASPTRRATSPNTAAPASIGLGLTNWWSIFAAGGGQVTQTGGDWQGGVINGIAIAGPVQRLPRARRSALGTKINFHSEDDPDLRFGLWLAGLIPVEHRGPSPTPTATLQRDQLATAADWEWGGAVTKGCSRAWCPTSSSGQPTDIDVRRAEHPAVRLRRGDPGPADRPHPRSRSSTTTSTTAATSPEPDYGAAERRRPLLVRRTPAGPSPAALNTNLNMLVRPRHQPEPVRRHRRHHLRRVAAGSPAAGRRPGCRRAVVEQPAPAPTAAPVAPAPAARRARRPRHDDRRDLLRRQERPPDQHRQGGARRRRAAHEERPERDGRRHRLHRQHGHRAGQRGARA